MKRRTEKPSDHGMQFFTPELYLRYNSANEGEADRAERDWETAIQRYHKHLDDLQLPQQVGELAQLTLHDAEIISLAEKFQPVGAFPGEMNDSALPPIWSALGFLSTQQGDKVVTLIYLLWERVHEHEPPKDWPFSKTRRHWLYDEVDVAPGRRGSFVHRVLLSDGAIIEVPFVSVFIHPLQLQAAVNGESRSA